MSNFSGSSNFVITGGNFGTIEGSVNHITYGAGITPVPPNHIWPSSPAQIAPAASSTAPSTTSSTPPSSQTASPASDTASLASSHDTSYVTAPSTQSRQDTSSAATSPRPQSHIPPASTSLSSISLDLQQLPTTPNPTSTSLYNTPNSRPSDNRPNHYNPGDLTSPLNTPKPQFSDEWHNQSLGYSHRRGQSLPSQSDHVPPVPPPAPPISANTSTIANQGTPPQANCLLRVINNTPTPNPVSRSTLPLLPPPPPPPSIPYHSRPGRSESSPDPEFDPSAEYARLQSQWSTRDYPTSLNPSASPIHPGTNSNYIPGAENNRDYDTHTQYPRTPTNDLGLYTTPSQPNIPPVSTLPRSFSPSGPSTTNTGTIHPPLPPPPPPPSYAHRHGAPWSPGAINTWSNDITQSHEPPPQQYLSPQNMMSLRQNNVIDTAQQRGVYGYASGSGPALPLPGNNAGTGIGMSSSSYTTATGAAPLAPRDDSPPPLSLGHSQHHGGTPPYAHISPFMPQPPSVQVYTQYSSSSQSMPLQAPGSPFVLNTAAGMVRRDRMEMREPGFHVPQYLF